MKTKETKQSEQTVRRKLSHLFGASMKALEFLYFGKVKGVIVTYEDFKPERELMNDIASALGPEWKVVLKREYSDFAIMNAMLQLYKENKVSIMWNQSGDIQVARIRVYVNDWMNTTLF